MGDDCLVETDETGAHQITQSGLRIARGIEGHEREDLLACWIELWRGAIHANRIFLDVSCEITSDQLIWTIREKDAA
ncbi:MAG: hypothetical protein KJN90_09945 [Gammaproteobacteria bacterium]|nr:hypothetical protein [Gammaproteobacteria bacterium]